MIALPRWRHKVGVLRTLVCILWHVQSWHHAEGRGWWVECECGRQWERTE